MDLIKLNLNTLGIHHDNFASETEIVNNNEVQLVIDKLKKGNFVYQGKIKAPKEEDKTDQPHYGQQKFLFRLDHSKNLTDYIFTFSGTNLNQETMGYVKGFEIYENKEISKTNPDPEAFRDTYSIRSALKIIKNLKDATLSLTPFIRYNDMSFKMHFLPGKPLEKNSHKSIGLQTLYTKEIKNLNLYLGGDIELTEGKLSEFQDAPDVSFGPRLAYPKGAHYDYSVDSRILSIYINLENFLLPKRKLLN